jgi:hypothetical protein
MVLSVSSVSFCVYFSERKIEDRKIEDRKIEDRKIEDRKIRTGREKRFSDGQSVTIVENATCSRVMLIQ